MTEALTAREAESIIDETRTNQFGLCLDGLRTFLDPERQPASCFDVVELAGLCCDLDSAERPTATDVLARLESILADVTVYGA